MNNFLKSRTYKLKPNLGFMMVEVLVAASIITVSVLAAMSVTSKALSISRQSLHQSQVAFLLEEGAENARITRDNAWANLANSSETIGIFTRQTNIATVYRDANYNIVPSGTLDIGTKLITLTVSWNEGGQTIIKTLPFYLNNIFL